MTTDETKLAEAGTLPDYVHQHGCPARPDRVEAFEVRGPSSKLFRVVRCVDCGAQVATPIEGEVGDDG